jgi:outer membrane protein OmpA-like peptidoglycan-associated protein
MGGGLFALLSSGGDGEPTDQAAVEADADEDTGSSPDETGDDGDITPVTTAQADEETDPADDAMDDSSTSTDAAADTGIVTIQVPMRDIKGVSPEAAGTADFEFNTETGEICYTFEAEGVQGPFATHIHVGANGIRGGIVVDFGPNESPAAGCVDNPPDDTADILAFPASHYAELHDAGGEFTVRGQLSDQAPSDEEQPELAFTDPDGGGAQAVVEAGRIVLQGPIADRMTADRLAAEYAALGLAGVDVIDNLTVAADAPPPSGRVVLNDAILFAVGSAELGATDQGVLDVLVAVATSDPNSTMTIVGHTDSTGDPVANLELSLERANALRDVLVGAGIPLERLRVEGAGDTDPLGDNATAEGRALNRRIEVELKPAVG